jgi:hypothetical protein
MSSTTLSRKHKASTPLRSAMMQAIQIAVGSSSSANAEVLTPRSVAATSNSSVIATYANTPESEVDDYFKPHFAKHLHQRLSAPLDENAPEGTQNFMDWLNAE